MPAISSSSNFPAAPTKGSPWRSSFLPGASPTSMRSAPGSPTPKTTLVLVSESRHAVHTSARSRRAENSWLALVTRSTIVALGPSPRCGPHRVDDRVCGGLESGLGQGVDISLDISAGDSEHDVAVETGVGGADTDCQGIVGAHRQPSELDAGETGVSGHHHQGGVGERGRHYGRGARQRASPGEGLSLDREHVTN